MFSQVYMAGTIIIPISGMEKLRLSAKTLPEVQPRQFDTEQHSHPQGFAIQMHKPTPDNRISETNGTGETCASHLLISQMKTLFPPPENTCPGLHKNEMRSQKATYSKKCYRNVNCYHHTSLQTLFENVFYSNRAI